MMIDFRERLDALIDGFLRGKSSLEEFQREYERVFIDEMPDSALNSSELELYGMVHEKSEWTAAEPTTEEKGYGWMDPGEFTRWLADYRARFRG